MKSLGKKQKLIVLRITTYIVVILLFVQIGLIIKYAPTRLAFETTKELTGAYTFYPKGRGISASRINGQIVYATASFIGGQGPVIVPTTVQNNKIVVANVSNISTIGGLVTVVTSLKCGNVTCFENSFDEFLSKWRTGSLLNICFSMTLIIGAALIFRVVVS
jgi:hypothetical protein